MTGFDPSAFLRPIAHRGLHGPGRLENTAPAFEAAVAEGFGVECDVRATADGEAVVFHDATLDRLTDRSGPVSAMTLAELRGVRHRGGEPILEFGEFLQLVAGRVPILAELKSDWDAVDPRFVGTVAAALRTYDGDAAAMSFDPALLSAIKAAAPETPRGLASRDFLRLPGRDARMDDAQAYRLTNFLDWAVADPDFIAFDVTALPSPVPAFIREGLGIPLFAWTIRTKEEWRKAAACADAAIFERLSP